MNKKVWFFLFCIQSIILLLILEIFLWPIITTTFNSGVDLKEYLYQEERYNFLPDTGYIPDAKTAKVIGSSIIDNLTGNNGFKLSGIMVDYDEKNRLWRIQKGYLFGNGGIVIIEQDSGKIIKAILTK